MTFRGRFKEKILPDNVRMLNVSFFVPHIRCEFKGCAAYDACRAGLLHGLMHGLDWGTTGCIASFLGALKIECRGSQNHSFTLPEFERRYQDSFGRAQRMISGRP